MTNEEFNRKIEFLLNQQAWFDAGMQKLQEAQAISEEKIGKAAETAEKAAETAEHALEAVTQLTEITARHITTTTDGFHKLFESMRQTNEKIDVLVDSQIRTDERLRETFERHLREHHHGRNGLEN